MTWDEWIQRNSSIIKTRLAGLDDVQKKAVEEMLFIAFSHQNLHDEKVHDTEFEKLVNDSWLRVEKSINRMKLPKNMKKTLIKIKNK